MGQQEKDKIIDKQCIFGITTYGGNNGAVIQYDFQTKIVSRF